LRAKRHHDAMSQCSASPMRIVDSIAWAFTDRQAPGRPRHTGQTCVFGSAPNVVSHPQNIFEAVPSSTWVSRPMTGSNCALQRLVVRIASPS
jgi:hypothetical protein